VSIVLQSRKWTNAGALSDLLQRFTHKNAPLRASAGYSFTHFGCAPIHLTLKDDTSGPCMGLADDRALIAEPDADQGFALAFCTADN
jgi:hypothetical protein